MSDLPEYYFRIRDNGAVVRRIDMEEIAFVNIKNGNVKPHGDRIISVAEQALIGDWLAARLTMLAAREIDDIHRAVDHLNLTTHWAQTKASNDELEAVTDALLLAMHDLRTVLVRKKAERLVADETT
jgi:hypothetical protein